MAEKLDSDLAGWGAPGTQALTIDIDEQRLLSAAVRESVRRQVLAILRLRKIDSRHAIPCPSCGERSILLKQPRTYVFDRTERDYLCKACAAEREFARMVHPQADIGGEGG